MLGSCVLARSLKVALIFDRSLFEGLSFPLRNPSNEHEKGVMPGTRRIFMQKEVMARTVLAFPQK